MHKRVNGTLVSENGKETYSIWLDLELKPNTVDEEREPVGWILVNRIPVPGQKLPPEGKYTLQPHEHHPKESQVHISGRRMLAGWR